MNSTKATLTFAVTFTFIAFVDAIGARDSSKFILLGFALLAPVATLAFWLGARRAEHRWYSIVIAVLASRAVVSMVLRIQADLQLSRWALLSVVVVALAATAMFLGRTPITFGARKEESSST